jgi:hypothetical protein
MTILFIVKYEKITIFDEFLVLLGPIISRFFACSNEEKKVLALVLSLSMQSTLKSPHLNIRIAQETNEERHPF